MIITSTMSLVFLTTVILGALMPFLIKRLKPSQYITGLEDSTFSFRKPSNLFYYDTDIQKYVNYLVLIVKVKRS